MTVPDSPPTSVSAIAIQCKWTKMRFEELATMPKETSEAKLRDYPAEIRIHGISNTQRPPFLASGPATCWWTEYRMVYRKNQNLARTSAKATRWRNEAGAGAGSRYRSYQIAAKKVKQKTTSRRRPRRWVPLWRLGWETWTTSEM